MEHNLNRTILRGTLVNLPQYSHGNHGITFYRFLLNVPRLSGTSDVLPVIASGQVLDQLDLSGGSELLVQGQM